MSLSIPVLVVEEDAGTRWLVSELIRSRGHRVIAVADALTAWSGLHEHPPELVLLSDLQLCRRIRAEPALSDPVILVITDTRAPAALQAALDAGADDLLERPVDLAVLGARVTIAEREVGLRHRVRLAELRSSLESDSTSALLANLDEVIFSVDARAGRLTSISRASERVVGRTPEDLLADPDLARALVFPEEIERTMDELGRAPGRALMHRWQIRLPDGSMRWVEVSAKGALDENDALARVDGILADVTERQRVQDELAERNQELRTLFRISEIALGATSTESAYEELLEELSRATGFPIVAIERYDPVHDRLVIAAARGIPLGGGALEIALDETLSGIAVRTGQPVIETDARDRSELAHPALRALGVRTWLAFPMVVGGSVVGTLTLAQVESVAPDPRTIRWVGSLANGVAQFIDRITAGDALRDSERRHRQLAEQLQQANQELERFAYSVSHDLRAPLRTMQGFAHALIQNFGDKLPAEARDYAQRIIASGQQSEVLIRDLLAYSRLSFEGIELQPVDLAAVVRAAKDQLDGDLKEAGATIVIEGELGGALGQATMLVQVVANLISNAIKFTPVARRPRVRIRVEDGAPFVRLWVEDNGIGVPAGQEERIFRVFERLTESGGRTGTGIGLAIVRRGMERMGGRAGVTVAPGGEGSAFWVDIPRAEGGPGPRGWPRRKRDGA